MKKFTKWSIEADGDFLGGVLHDGIVTEFKYIERELFSLLIVLNSGKKLKFVFSDVSYMRIEEFTGRKIIFEMNVWKISNAPGLLIDYSDSPWRALFKNLSFANIQKFQSSLLAKKKNDFLVRIACSNGGDIALIAHEILVYK